VLPDVTAMKTVRLLRVTTTRERVKERKFFQTAFTVLTIGIVGDRVMGCKTSQ
jgi:hypothetical protein